MDRIRFLLLLILLTTAAEIRAAQTTNVQDIWNQTLTIASSASATLDDLKVQAATTTVTGTTAITTSTGFNKISIYQPTFTDASAVTITNAATVYIAGAPLAAGSLTITKPFALWVAAGATRLDGVINLAGSTGTSGQVLTSQGASVPIWANVAGGSNGSVQYNSSGASAGNSILTYDGFYNFLMTSTNNAISFMKVINSSTGASADAAFIVQGAANVAEFGSRGTNETATGVMAGGDAYVYNLHNSGVGDLAIASETIIKFGAGSGDTEVARITSTGLQLGNATQDTGLARNAAGVVEVNNGTAATYRDVKLRNVNFQGAPFCAVITSTTDQTTTGPQTHITYTIPANSVVVGTTYHYVIWGNFDNGTTQITYTVQSMLGGNQIGNLTFNSLASAQTNKEWRAEGNVIFRTTGSSGTAFAEQQVKVNGATTTDTDSYHLFNLTSALTVNTTTTETLLVQLWMSATTGTPHIRSLGGYIQQVN